VEIVHLRHPTVEEFHEAAEVCQERMPYWNPAYHAGRFVGFQKLGVELVVARHERRMQAVCFALPVEHVLDGQQVKWVHLFQLASRREGPGVGGMLLLQIMKIYPAIVSMGVTPAMDRLYPVLKWKRHESVWRGVHPLSLARTLGDYGTRLGTPWQRRVLGWVAVVYDAASPLVEWLLATGATGTRGAAEGGRKGAVASYLELLRSGELEMVDVDGIGRVAGGGWASWRRHAALWRAMRRRGVRFCEMLLLSDQAKHRALWRGYVPVAMSTWYRDPSGVLDRVMPRLEELGLSFLDTDKIV
jgi:hypothetical protein